MEGEGREDTTDSDRREVMDQTVRDLNEHGVRFKRIALESLLNPVGEDEVTETMTIENQGEFIAGAGGIEEESQGSDVEEEFYSIEEELKGLAVTGSVLDRLGRMDKSLQRRLRACQKDLRLERQAALRQSTILDHFRKQ